MRCPQIQRIYERRSMVLERLRTTDIKNDEKHVLFELRTTEEFFENDM